MNNPYLKQAWHVLLANPLVGIISISGTALAIGMIMVSVFVFQIKVIGYPPESNRGRMLYVSTAIADPQRPDLNSNRSGMSAEVIKQVFYPLTIPEAVCGMFVSGGPVSIPGKRLYKEYSIRATDASFWTIFDFSFVEGTPFGESDFNSAVRKAVISESTAGKLYGAESPVGKTFIYQQLEYTVTGVVKDVSRMATNSYAEIWIPYSTTKEAHVVSGNNEGINGAFQVVLLAANKKDFTNIKEELLHSTALYNTSKTDYKVIFPNAPFSHLDIVLGSADFKKVSWTEYLLQNGSLLLFLLLVPALNLTGVTHASVLQRKSEIGIRKSFGATYSILFRQIVCENMLISCIGGVIGLFLSLGLLFINKSYLLGINAAIQPGMLFHPLVFIAALFFTMLLNLLSSSIPAMRIARQSIIDAMKDNE